MSMELLNQFMNDAVNFTFTAIVLALTLIALAAIWRRLIGVSIRFEHWLCPWLARKKKNNSSDSKIQHVGGSTYRAAEYAYKRVNTKKRSWK